MILVHAVFCHFNSSSIPNGYMLLKRTRSYSLYVFIQNCMCYNVFLITNECFSSLGPKSNVDQYFIMFPLGVRLRVVCTVKLFVSWCMNLTEDNPHV